MLRLIALFFLCHASAYAASPIKVLSLADGAVVPADRILVVDYAFEREASGEHLHAMVDGRLISMLRSTEGAFPVGRLEPGEHELKLDLRNPDHSPMGPELVIRFSVEGTKPTEPEATNQSVSNKPEQATDTPIRITSLKPGAVVPAGKILLVDYSFDRKTPGEHLHAMIDGRLISMLRKTEGTFPLGRLEPGQHELKLDLRNPDHSPMGPQVTVRFDVADTE